VHVMMNLERRFFRRSINMVMMKRRYGAHG
jgi:hypothetical protein